MNSSMNVGTFRQDQYGTLHGQIRGLGIGVISAILEPQINEKGETTFYKIIANPVGDSYEIGKAWQRMGQDGLYYSIALDSPVFPAPINLGLFQDNENPDIFNLVFKRQKFVVATPEANATQPTNRRFMGAQATL